MNKLNIAMKWVENRSANIAGLPYSEEQKPLPCLLAPSLPLPSPGNVMPGLATAQNWQEALLGFMKAAPGLPATRSSAGPSAAPGRPPDAVFCVLGHSAF